MDCLRHTADTIVDSLTRRKHLPSNHIRSLALVFLLSCRGTVRLAQAPVLSKIDPPNWWGVQGEHLEGARFSIRNSDTPLTWYVPLPMAIGAFLKLGTESAKPGSFLLEAQNCTAVRQSPTPSLLAGRPPQTRRDLHRKTRCPSS